MIKKKIDDCLVTTYQKNHCSQNKLFHYCLKQTLNIFIMFLSLSPLYISISLTGTRGHFRLKQYSTYESSFVLLAVMNRADS